MTVPRVLVEDIGDISDDVIYPESELVNSAQGEPSPSRIVLRDLGPIVRDIPAGKRVTVDLDGTTLWAGFVLQVVRAFWFDVDYPDTMQRRNVMLLVDLNALFNARIVFKQSAPEHFTGPMYRTPTYDDTIIEELLANWLDLSADDIDTTSLVERVAIVNPSSGSCDPPDQSFYPFNGSMKWGEAMTVIGQVPAAIWGMLPGAPLGSSPFGRLFYADADVEDAPFALSDRPPGSGFVGAGGGSSSIVGEWADSAADAGVVTDPPVGTTTIESDFTGFTSDGSEPTTFADFTGNPGGYTGWLKIVLTVPMVLRFNTYGSGIEDTILAMWHQDSPPATADAAVDISDDTQETGFNDGTWSALPDSDAIDGYSATGRSKLYAAGTYWLGLTPYAGASWDTSEGTARVSIIRSSSANGTFHDDRDGTAVAAWAAPWDFSEPPEADGSGSSIDVHEDGGSAHIDSVASETVGAGNSFAGANLLRHLDPPVVAADEWTMTVHLRADLVASGANFYRIDVALDSLNSGFYISFAGGTPTLTTHWPTGSVTSGTFTWDDTPQIVELKRTSDGTIESRIWPESGSRPGSPLTTATDDGPLSAGIIEVRTRLFASIPGTATASLDLSSVDIASTPAIGAGGGGGGGPAVDEGSVGYREMTIWEGGAELVNDSMAWGAGKGSDHMVFDRRISSPSVDLHGLWQKGDVLFNIWCQDTIEKVTDTIVNGSPSSRRGHKNDVLSIECITVVDGLLIGQKVRFINHGEGIDEVIPIRRSTISFPTRESRNYKLLLSEALDQWGFENPMPPFAGFRWPPVYVPPRTEPPTPITVIVCYPGFVPLDDPSSWGAGWTGSNTAYSKDQDGVTVPPTPLALLSSSGSIAGWQWQPHVAAWTVPSGPIGSGGITRYATYLSGPGSGSAHIFAQFYVTLTSDETGDIDDAMVNSEDPANNTGAMSWSLWLGTFVVGYSGGGGNVGLRMDSNTGNSSQDRGTHLSVWGAMPSSSVFVGSGSGAPSTPGPVTPVIFNELAGTLTIEGDPTQITLTFHNDADGVEVSTTITAVGPQVFAYGNFWDLQIVGGRGTPGAGTPGGYDVRTFLRTYAATVQRLVMKLWDDDEPPDGIICGPIYAVDHEPVPITPGLQECEIPTKLTARNYATGYVIASASLRVKLDGRALTMGPDYLQIEPNVFHIMFDVDPASIVIACYVTG